MLKDGILNPQLLSLISRIRHTNTLVVADYAFPFWPTLETIDLSLMKGVPTVRQVLDAVMPVWKCGQVWMAEEFTTCNDQQTVTDIKRACHGAPIIFEPHVDFKKRVPSAIGLIRTGDDTIYANMILESA